MIDWTLISDSKSLIVAAGLLGGFKTMGSIPFWCNMSKLTDNLHLCLLNPYSVANNLRQDLQISSEESPTLVLGNNIADDAAGCDIIDDDDDWATIITFEDVDVWIWLGL